jgi:hypothetical protein
VSAAKGLGLASWACPVPATVAPGRFEPIVNMAFHQFPFRLLSHPKISISECEPFS